MKRKIIIPILAAGAVLIFAGCQKKSGGGESGVQNGIQNKEEIGTEITAETQNLEKARVDLSGWKTYDNGEYGYHIKYPKDWFFVSDYCCPPPPAAVNINNYSSKKLEHASHQLDAGVQGMEIVCLYEGKIDDIGEVQYFRNEGRASELKKVNGFDAIRFEQDRGPGSPVGVFTYYIVDGQQGCRLTFESSCTSCEDIVSTFKFQ